MQTSVKSIVFAAQNEVICSTETADLSPPPDGVVIETRYSCISAGTELAKLTGLQEVSFPLPIGNRAIGRVVETGPECERFETGDLVFSHIHHASHAVGTLLVAALPDELDRPEAAMLGMALVAYCGVCVAKPVQGGHALVTGAGLVGQILSQLLLVAGVTPILADRVESRLTVARDCGIPHTVNVDTTDLSEAVMGLTEGRGVEYAFECTGRPAVTVQALPCCAQSGQFVLVGSPRGEHVTDITPILNHVHICGPHGDLTLRGAHEWKIPLYPSDEQELSQQGNLETLAGHLVAGRLTFEPLLTMLCKPEDCQQAYDQLRDGSVHQLGVVFDWQEA